MGHLELSAAELTDLIRSPVVDEIASPVAGPAAIVVDGTDGTWPAPGALPMVVIALGDPTGPSPEHADLVVPPADVGAVLATIDAAPLAAVSLAVLLRDAERRGVEAGLAAESAVYSTLQAGPEFAAWRATADHRADRSDAPTVRVDRRDGRLDIVLDRPHRHNAVSARLRDDLTAALRIAVADPSVTSVTLAGAGASFCSGGDLGEFATFPDPATAHVTRLTRSPARLMHLVAARTRVHVHGSAYGGGIELAAFAGRVTADPDTAIALPEVGLGLVPGAGGTVSITRRAGRRRTALLALRGTPISAAEALSWGLVDAIDRRPPVAPA